MRNYMKTRKKKLVIFHPCLLFFTDICSRRLKKENYENNIFYLSHVLRCFLCAGTRQ